jgi:hypothetical protein
MSKRQASRNGIPAKKVIENNLRQNTQSPSSPTPQKQQQQQQDVPVTHLASSPAAQAATANVNINGPPPHRDEHKKAGFWQKLTCGLCH